MADINNRRLFSGDMTYDEWSAQRDHANFEFQAIDRGHKSFPGYNLEEIKKEIYTNYIIAEDNQKVFQETFGDRHVNSDKLNQQMSKLIRVVFSSSSDFKSVDKRGHGDTVSARFGGRGKGSENVSFRVEEKAIRYAHYLIEHNMVEEQTVSDMVRKGFVKYIEMVPTINELRDAVTDRFLLDMRIERELNEKTTVAEMLKGFEIGLESKEQDLMEALRHLDNKEELEEIRDWIVNFIKNALSYNGPTKTEKAKVKEFVMRNSRLYNILTTLEREKLVTKEYIDNVRQKGIIIVPFNVISNNELNKQG